MVAHPVFPGRVSSGRRFWRCEPSTPVVCWAGTSCCAACTQRMAADPSPSHPAPGDAHHRRPRCSPSRPAGPVPTRSCGSTPSTGTERRSSPPTWAACSWASTWTANPVPVGGVVPSAPSPGVSGDRAEDRIDVSAVAAHVYTECARIFNPIHTDVAVAEASGLPGPILHGTATLAMAVSAVVDRCRRWRNLRRAASGLPFRSDGADARPDRRAHRRTSHNRGRAGGGVRGAKRCRRARRQRWLDDPGTGDVRPPDARSQQLRRRSRAQ